MRTSPFGLRLRRLAYVLAIALLAPAASYGANGTALGVNPEASALDKSSTRVLTVGADLNIGETVVTGDEGQVQILFEDKTELVVGPRSRLVLEDYLLRADGSAGKLAISALAGTFRFATGKAAKDRYLIKTPTGTIGVRGTEFDFTVLPQGTKVLLFHGGLRLCNLAGNCVDLNSSCEVGTYDSTQALLLGNTDGINGEDRKVLRSEFPYADVQTPLLRQFWVSNARECLNRPFVGNTQTNLDSSSDRSRPPPVIDECSKYEECDR